MPAIMVVGTASNAGKSLICAALCRIFAQRGLRVSPFKGQNMALNSYVTHDGGEIGYAQAVQAWAARVEPSVEMNPILLKPQGDMTSQVIFLGQAVGATRADEYYQNYFDPGWQCITRSLQKLETSFDLIVCEGAGSPAEVNLKHRDLTNMRVAQHLNATTLLVVNIDLGGAFAHVVGTLQLLTADERSLIKGIIINKFRGQRSLLQSGIDWLEEYTGIPVIGVIPYLDIAFPAEDSVSLFERRSRLVPAEIEIAVLRLPRISNFTDFDPLIAEPTVDVRYVMPPESLGQPDAVILPGSKTTIADLLVLQETGTIDRLRDYVRSGGTIMGICGGMQMLGEAIADPDGKEGQSGIYAGLGMLPINTTISARKILRQRQARSLYPCEAIVSGYEIHQGISDFSSDSLTTSPLFDDPDLGMVSANQKVLGTYLHGIFDNGKWRRSWLNLLRDRKGLAPLPIEISDYHIQRDLIFERLAEAIAPHLNLEILKL
ncbi:cobyric acid synthase CobQ [Pseudanabaena sp. PCC 6802]|uniref:cobyric acid synthase CobQ n=1 Tax=Pseudanabaena sp. PCC 6802 TaxID=118173 RepID=UPI00034AFDA4|nr:cobyric acid synthase CobQ [Pseudanabaena sp. PCC 6802]